MSQNKKGCGMERKYKTKAVTYDKEFRIVSMYKKDQMLTDIARAVGLNRITVRKVLDAHGIRKPYKPAEAKKARRETNRGTIIQQCVAGVSDRHKRITDLFKPTMTA